MDRLPRRVDAESGCPVYPLVAGGHIFHVYWGGRSFPLANILPIESFLATQDLDAGHRLWFWHDAATPPPSDIVERFSGPDSPYRNYVSFRAFVPADEVRGTCYEVRFAPSSAR